MKTNTEANIFLNTRAICHFRSPWSHHTSCASLVNTFLAFFSLCYMQDASSPQRTATYRCFTFMLDKNLVTSGEAS
jgi:hypothetical protein